MPGASVDPGNGSDGDSDDDDHNDNNKASTDAAAAATAALRLDNAIRPQLCPENLGWRDV